jgi:two-component system, sensor histidine kinase and response regulator
MNSDIPAESHVTLVIDDELGIREGCRRVLEPQGHRVETAGTLREGLDRIRSDAFDLVLLDVMMPDGRGLDLLDPIHERDPDTVTIIITGYATVELAVEAIKAGAYDFISKPFTPDLLTITVNQALERRRLTLEARRLAEVERQSAELARSKREAEQLSDLKTAFTLKVAHELRAPVAGAISLIRPLIRGLAGDLNEHQRDILNRIDNRLEILLALVEDLLSLAAARTAIPHEKQEQVTLQSAVRKVVDRLAVEAEAKSISLGYEEPGTPLVVWATPRALDTIVSNLLNNAIKYTPEAGRIDVRLVEQNGHAHLTVTDTGIGIPKGDLSRIGDEFFRAGNARRSHAPGTGLGLSIVKELVGSFGGSLEIDSTEGRGTTVGVSLPTAESPA